MTAISIPGLSDSFPSLFSLIPLLELLEFPQFSFTNSISLHTRTLYFRGTRWMNDDTPVSGFDPRRQWLIGPSTSKIALCEVNLSAGHYISHMYLETICLLKISQNSCSPHHEGSESANFKLWQAAINPIRTCRQSRALPLAGPTPY